MEYNDAVAELEEIGRHSVKHPLAHTRILLDRLGAPDLSLPAIHVAGTNGKGSVCAYLNSVLERSGRKTALFTSPHLQKIEERMMVNGRMPAPDRFAELYEKVKRAAQETGTQPSYFEVLYLMAMVFFAEEGAEIAVIETGMGGRFDVTSAGRKDIAAVITSIDYDHKSYLGDTLHEISGHKAGIIRDGRPCILLDKNPEVTAVIRAEAAEKKAPLFVLRPEEVRIQSVNAHGEIDFCTPFRYDGHTVFSVESRAPYQAENAALALLTLKTLTEEYPDRFAQLSYRETASGLLSMKWPGRMEEIRPHLFLDGAHNPDGIRRFAEAVNSILQTKKSREAVLLFSAVSDKDSTEMIRMLAASVSWSAVIVTEIDDRRKSSAADLAAIFHEAGVGNTTIVTELPEAVRQAELVRGTGELFICGSLYLIGEIRELLTSEEVSAEENGFDGSGSAGERTGESK